MQNNDDLQKLLAQVLAAVKPRLRQQTHDPNLPTCPLCGAKAFSSEYAGPYDIHHDCDCETLNLSAYLRGLDKVWRSKEYLRRFVEQLPALYQDYSFESMPDSIRKQNPKAVADLLSIVEYKKPISVVYLWGQPGVGKTTLAVALGRELCNRGLRCGFFHEATWYNDLLRAERTRYSAVAEAYPDPTTYDAAIIDDLGAMSLGAGGKLASKDDVRFAREIYAALEHFYSRKKPLILTSQFDPGTAAAKVSLSDTVEAAKRWASRMTSGAVYQIRGARDYRLRPDKGGA